jgi:hypothetical protein
MKNFTRPKNLNGSELIEELLAVGIEVTRIVDNSDGTISFDTSEELKAAKVVEAHNGNIVPREPSIEDKLASVGLNLDDLKKALGL